MSVWVKCNQNQFSPHCYPKNQLELSAAIWRPNFAIYVGVSTHFNRVK
ncbi:hypothetical protein V6Z11_A05G377400 [Gossypium hirsutum]